MEGRLLRRVELGLPSDAPPLRERLMQAGIRCYEAGRAFRHGLPDAARPARRAVDRHAVRRPSRRRARKKAPGGIDRVFVDPELAPADFPAAAAGAVDRHRNRPARPNACFRSALYGCGAAEVLLCRPDAVARGAGARQPAAGRDRACPTNGRCCRFSASGCASWRPTS